MSHACVLINGHSNKTIGLLRDFIAVSNTHRFTK